MTSPTNRSDSSATQASSSSIDTTSAQPSSSPTSPPTSPNEVESPVAAPLPEGLNGELRLGLAMCGGIALTLYEAGVSHELFRFYKAWEAYVQHRDQGKKFPLPSYDPLSAHVPNQQKDMYASQPHGYLQAFQKVPLQPVVDILTGASAGGINSVFLASCIATGQDFGRFHDVWIDVADIQQLQFKTTEPARGLLNPAALEDAMRTQLWANLKAYLSPTDLSPTEKQKLDEIDLDVRLCRTHQKGHQQKTIDTIGHVIDVEQKADVVGFGTEHFRDKGSASKNSEQIDELVRAALATSAFPGIFPPVYDPTEGRWYVDGGLWDNQPIDLAVEAVQDKAAFGRTHRCLLFVEPNPIGEEDPTTDLAGSPKPPSSEDEPSQGSVLQSLLFMGLKGNIGPALETILHFNQRNQLYDLVVSNSLMIGFAQQFGWQQFVDSAQQCQKARAWAQSPRGTTLPVGDPLKVTALNQKRIQSLFFDDDPALIQEWQALLQRLGYSAETSSGTSSEGQKAAWLSVASLALLGREDIEQRLLRARLLRINKILERSSVLTPQEKITVDEEKKEVRSMAEISAEKAAIYARLGELDQFLYDDSSPATSLPYPQAATSNTQFRFKNQHRRSRYRACTEEMLRRVREKLKPYRGSPIPSGKRQQVLDEIWVWFGDVQNMTQSSQNQDSSLAKAAHSTTATVPDTSSAPDSLSPNAQRTKEMYVAHRRATLPSSSEPKETQKVSGVASETTSQRSKAVPSPNQKATAVNPSPTDTEFSAEFSAAWQQLQLDLKSVHGMLDEAEAVARGSKDKNEVAVPTEPQSYSMEQYVWVDLTLFVLAALSDLVEKRSIDLVRVSGNDTDNTHLISDNLEGRGTAAQRKLAGEGLGHVSGFLENRWRRNDYVWGRLDACEILLRTLRYYGAREGLPVNEEERQLALQEAQRLEHLGEGDAEFRAWRFRAFGGMTDAEYEECLEQSQTAILQQEACLFQLWYKKRVGEAPDNWDAKDCEGLPVECATSDDPNSKQKRKKTQNANARIIGFGRECLVDADEPTLSQNLNYLIQATIRLTRGTADKAPQQLEFVARVSRVLSYAVSVFSWVVPLPVHKRVARKFWPWVLGTAFLVAIASCTTYFLASRPTGGAPVSATSLSATSAFLVVLRGALVAAGLVFVGALLGFRWWLASIGLFCVGLGSGFLVASASWPFTKTEPTSPALFWIAVGLFAVVINVTQPLRKAAKSTMSELRRRLL